MVDVTNVLNKIDRVLSNDVGDFGILTACVDYITIKVAKDPDDKKRCQALTYLSKPLDLLIQLVVSPIFIVYQTVKSVYKSFKNDGACSGIFAVVLSPLNFGVKAIWNLFSTSFITTPLNLVIPVGTALDYKCPKRAMTRIVEFNNKFGMFDSAIEDEGVRAVKAKMDKFQDKMLSNIDSEEVFDGMKKLTKATVLPFRTWLNNFKIAVYKDFIKNK